MVFPHLDGSSWLTGDPELPIKIVLHGLFGPVTVDGKQYIAVVSGWGVDAQWIQGKMHDLAGWEKAVPEGGSVWVFALGD